MMYIKFKWLPWIVIIAGVYGLFSGEWDPILAIVFIAAGGIWAYLWYGNKKSSSSTANSVVPPAPQVPYTPKVCPNCGSAVEDGMVFCSKCGTKV